MPARRTKGHVLYQEITLMERRPSSLQSALMADLCSSGGGRCSTGTDSLISIGMQGCPRWQKPKKEHIIGQRQCEYGNNKRQQGQSTHQNEPTYTDLGEGQLMTGP